MPENDYHDDPEVVVWDWKAEPDWGKINRLLRPYGAAIEVLDTGSDECAVRVTLSLMPY